MFYMTISNPSTLKSVLRIAAEVTYADLSKYQTDNIKMMINELPDSVSSTNIVLNGDQLIDLYFCIRFFRHSYTYKWMREEFINSLYELESNITHKKTVL